MVRGEPELARTTAESFIEDAKNEGAPPDIAAAFRTAGRTRLALGEFSQARAHLEEALRICDLKWDGEARRRHGTDCEISATAYLAHVVWQFGEVARARQLIDHAISRAIELAHVPTLANAYAFKTLLEIFRGDARAALRDAETLVEIAEKNGLAWFLDLATLKRGWARARLGDRGAGVMEMRDALRRFAEQRNWGLYPLSLGHLAELEAEAQNADEASAHIDEALALAERTGERWTDALLNRIRGDVLLKAHNPAAAEQAYLDAVAIARLQPARGFGLRAALSLAMLYQSTGRPVDAHAVLAPALDGFSLTSEMPEIAEAQALLAALADSDEVKAAVAQRERRLRLQTAYGQAMMYSKGFAAEETKAAFARAAELAANSDDFSERFAAFHGQWTLAFTRGELKSARELASTFLREAEAAGRMVEAGVARRGLALMSYLAGDFAEARIHCERALENCSQGRERDPQESLGEDTRATAMSCLAATMWQLGEVDRARELIEAANRRAAELGHAPSTAHPLQFKSYLENLRGDAATALTAAEALEALSREHGMPFWRASAELYVAWARSRLYDPAAGAAELQRALSAVKERWESWSGSWFVIAQLAQSELQTLGAARARPHR